MPLLHVQAPLRASLDAAPARKVFVSYAHQDYRLADKFIQFFQLLWRELGFEERDMFWDESRLLPGYVWEPILLESLSLADMLIFLVSENSLRPEHYSMNIEVASAAKAGIPIVPVVLTQCPWEGQPVPGYPVGVTLASLGALPRTAGRKVKAVTDPVWKRRDVAWTAVINGLRASLKALSAGASGTPALVSAPAQLPDQGANTGGANLLPYLCNQEMPIAAFERGLLAWQSRALIVLVKGIYDDNPSRFWERLRAENLGDWVETHPSCGPVLGADRPFTLPIQSKGARSPVEMKRAILAELSDTLTGNRYRISDPAQLASQMRAVTGAIPLFALPATASEDALKAALEGLLALLDEVAHEDILMRTVVVVTLEDPAMLERDLTAEWQLRRYKRSLVIELDPLATVTPWDARIWHKQRRIWELFRVEEDEVVKVFRKQKGLRMRSFDRRLRPLLGAR